MSKQATDETMADEAPEQVTADVSLADESPEEVELTPETFDLLEWLAGIGPAIAEYPMPGFGRIPMRARSEDWRREWVEQSRDLDDAERDRIFVAAHIADDRLTPDQLQPLQEHRSADWADMVGLAIHLDTRPLNQLAPRFLPGASG